MTAPRKLREQVIAAARALHARGWVANHDGNITARVAKNRFLATPTATSKADVAQDNLLEVDAQCKRLSGTARPFGELNLHLVVLGRRSDVNVVIHAHPPEATALACSGSNVLGKPFLAEAVVSLGSSIPTVPFAAPGPAAADALAKFVRSVDAVLLGNHGVLTWGRDVEQAYLRMELVEHLAGIARRACATGGVRHLPDETIEPLLRARAKAGLGSAATASGPVVACAPAPHANVMVSSRTVTDSEQTTALPAKGPDVAQLVREEVIRALSSS